MDVGALTPPLWGFEEREKLMVFYERACGARLHAAYFRPGGVHQDLPDDLIEDIDSWATEFPKVLADIDGLLTENRIFKQRNAILGRDPSKKSSTGAFPASWRAVLVSLGICAVRSLTNAMTSLTFRSQWVRTATAMTGICVAWRKCVKSSTSSTKRLPSCGVEQGDVMARGKMTPRRAAR